MPTIRISNYVFTNVTDQVYMYALLLLSNAFLKCFR